MTSNSSISFTYTKPSIILVEDSTFTKYKATQHSTDVALIWTRHGLDMVYITIMTLIKIQVYN